MAEHDRVELKVRHLLDRLVGLSQIGGEARKRNDNASTFAKQSITRNQQACVGGKGSPFTTVASCPVGLPLAFRRSY